MVGELEGVEGVMGRLSRLWMDCSSSDQVSRGQIPWRRTKPWGRGGAEGSKTGGEALLKRFLARQTMQHDHTIGFTEFLGHSTIERQ